MLGYKTSLSEFKMIKVTQNMFYDHNEVKLERKKGEIWEIPNIWKLSNPFLHNPQVKEDIIKEIRQYFELNENEKM